jgi:hypothetical protein
MGRPKKGDTTPRQTGRKDPKADQSQAHRDAAESRRAQRERAKALEASDSPWVTVRRVVRKRGKVSDAKLAELAQKVAQGGISLIDCSIAALLLEVDAEELRAAGDLTQDRAITVQRQLLKLKLDIAREYQAQGDPLPSEIKVQLTNDTSDETDTGDALTVH